MEGLHWFREVLGDKSKVGWGGERGELSAFHGCRASSLTSPKTRPLPSKHLRCSLLSFLQLCSLPGLLRLSLAEDGEKHSHSDHSLRLHPPLPLSVPRFIFLALTLLLISAECEHSADGLACFLHPRSNPLIFPLLRSVHLPSYCLIYPHG